MKRFNLSILLPLCFTFVLLSGCTNSGDTDKRLKALEIQVFQLKNQQDADQLDKAINEVAYLTPGAAGYSVIRTDLGSITVSLENVQPYANGSRVTLRFGNTTTATINGATMKIDWGTVDNKGTANNDTMKTMEYTIASSLEPGRWNRVKIVLEGLPPTNLGFVRIKEFSHRGIELLIPKE